MPEAVTEAAHEDLRPLLMSLAYRMLSSVSEAEDIVQEAFLRLHRATAEGTRIESAKAFLTTVTTRLAIDQLRSTRARRESYFGPWLPEPLVDELAPDVAQQAAMSDSLSMAFLLVLEALSPVERAVFLLREVFDYGYDEIAAIVDKSEAKRGVRVRLVHIGGQPGALIMDPDDRLIVAWSFDIADGAVQTIRGVINPDKLGHLGELSDLGRRRS